MQSFSSKIVKSAPISPQTTFIVDLDSLRSHALNHCCVKRVNSRLSADKKGRKKSPRGIVLWILGAINYIWNGSTKLSNKICARMDPCRAFAFSFPIQIFHGKTVLRAKNFIFIEFYPNWVKNLKNGITPYKAREIFSK